MPSYQSRCVSPRGLLFALLVAAVGLVNIGFPLAAQTACANPASGRPCVLTAQYDNNRDAYDGNETALTPSTVTGMSTSPKFQLTVDTTDLPINQFSNPITAQPLYVAQVTGVGNPSGTHDLLIGVTLNGTVFAWDADNGVCDITTGLSLCWSRQGYPGNLPGSGNALWYDDCGGITGGPVPTTANLPFAGIVATPVIDPTLSPPAIFLTSYCINNTPAYHWYLHKLKLTDGTDVVPHVEITTSGPAGTDYADDLTNGVIPFKPGRQLQRPALLEVPPPFPAQTSVSPAIYIAFGTIGAEATYANPYHGWLFGYSTSLVQQFNFVTTSRGCGTGGGLSNPAGAQCSKFNNGTGTPTCDCQVQTNFGNPPNWGGHGGGIWMSGRGPAASNLSDGNYHVFLGVGNGGFQEFQANGVSQLPNNWGESILDFRLSPTITDSTPYQSFTPWSAPLAPDLSSTLCADPNNPPNGTIPCQYTFESLNEYDYDMAVSGVLLFNDLGGTPRLVTVDKSGYGYLLTQGKLCGPNVTNCSLQNLQSPVQGFASGDPGNAFPFGAVSSLGVTTFCTAYQPDKCHRVTSLAFYKDGATKYLYLWPYQQRLTALQLSDNTAQAGTGSITGSGTAVTLTTGCTFGSTSAPCFTNVLVAGDQLVPSGQAAQTVTSVNSDTSLTVTPRFQRVKLELDLQWLFHESDPGRQSTRRRRGLRRRGANR